MSDVKILTKSLRKCQDRCQVLAMEKEELKRRLMTIENETHEVYASANKAEVCSSRYEEENKRLSEQLAAHLQQSNMANASVDQHRQECIEAKRAVQHLRDDLESVINDQRVQIENLQHTSDSALQAAESSKETLKILSDTVIFCISERAGLIRMLQTATSKLYALLYSPSSRPQLKVARRDINMPVKKEMASVREVASQLEKEIADASRSYKQLQRRLDDEISRVNPKQDMHKVCQALQTDTGESWDTEASRFSTLVNQLDTKLGQLHRLEDFLVSAEKNITR